MSPGQSGQVDWFAILVVMVATIALVVPETVFNTDDDPEQIGYVGQHIGLRKDENIP